jgi:4-hydroxybenzoate polyprenyltransferase
MTFFYVIPIFKLKNIEISFRNFPSVKIFSIAFAWAGISVFFPIYEAKMNITFDIFIEFIQRFALLIVIIIPFDIRDVKSDSDSLKTLPQVLGIKASKIIGMVLLLFTIGLEFFKMIFETSTIIIWVIIALITAIFLWFSSENKSRYYAGFWVESIPIYWLILVIYFLDNFK